MPSLDRPRLAVYVAAVLAIAFVGARYLHHPASGDASASPASGGAGFGGEAGGGGTGGDSVGSTGAGGAGDAAGGGAAGAGGGVADAAGAGAGAAGAPALVDVVGAVRRPGVYRLSAGARVGDAVRRAGGATRRAELAGVNLAARVVDGTQIVVPVHGQAMAAPVAGGGAGASAGSGAGGSPAAPSAPVNLNTASEAELEALDGVGPATAQKIIDYREQHGGFRTVDELDEVSGIGPRKLELLRPQVTV